jgi:hypothetical protein
MRSDASVILLTRKRNGTLPSELPTDDQVAFFNPVEAGVAQLCASFWRLMEDPSPAIKPAFPF